VEYLKDMGAVLDLNSVKGKTKVVLVRNEIDYRKPVRFDELLTVHTRISRIGESSFWMEGVLVDADTGEIAATNVAYHVWLDPSNDRPRVIGDEFRKQVEAYEGQQCHIEWPGIDV
jgi:acyl-CoA thioester hydrolase